MTKFKFGDKVTWKGKRAIFLGKHEEVFDFDSNSSFPFVIEIKIIRYVENKRTFKIKRQNVEISELKRGWRPKNSEVKK